MKVLTVHNRYRWRGGEDAVVDNTQHLLAERGVQAPGFIKSSQGLNSSIAQKAQAFFTGIHSSASGKEMGEVLAKEQPDVVHVHNLYPLLSPSVLEACTDAGVPVVMTLHNYRLTCPIASHFIHGELCRRCLDQGAHWCFLRNCRGSRVESAAYAARGVYANRTQVFARNVTVFIAISQFLKDFLSGAGYPADRIHVVYNAVSFAAPVAERGAGQYAAFVGRMSEEKGIPVLLEAAAQLPEMPVKIAGDGPLHEELQTKAPANVEFVGRLASEGLDAFYRNARFVVVPSVWYETFGLVAVEAMGRGVPVIASRIGGLQELIAEGEAGLLFEAGNATDLAAKMRQLWSQPEAARLMGATGAQRARDEYNEDTHFQRLMQVYEAAIARHAAQAA
jgi:glycosyltransferase involved in cell wall biosynthesis